MKGRILAILIVLCMMSVPLQAKADGNPTVSVSTGSVAQGETTEVSVRISGNPGIAAWMFLLSWDTSALSLDAAGGETAEVGEAFASGTLLAKQTDTGLTVSWYSVDNVGSDGELFRFRLKASGTAAGVYTISAACSEKNTIDVHEELISVSTEDGNVEVLSGTGGGQTEGPAGDTNSGGNGHTGPGASGDTQKPNGNTTGGGANGSGSSDSSAGGSSSAGSNQKPSSGGSSARPDTAENSADQTPPAYENPFRDVSADSYCYDAVLWAVRQGITTGTAADTFSPQATCTRAQMVTFLWRAAGSPAPVVMGSAFADVKTDSYYYKAVQWATENGITSGTSVNTFSPQSTVTRGQVAAFLWRASGSERADGTNPFTDVPAGQYYSDAVQWAAANGITSGTTETTFSPAAGCTRGQIVTFLYRNNRVQKES